MITDADREAERALRIKLAEISGFWHNPGDEGVLCMALAQHRLEAERRLVEKLLPLFEAEIAKNGEVILSCQSRSDNRKPNAAGLPPLQPDHDRGMAHSLVAAGFNATD